MKNPFVLAATMMATIAAAMRENSMRDFYGKNFQGHAGSSGASRNRMPFCSAGGKLWKKASKGQLTVRAFGRFGAPALKRSGN